VVVGILAPLWERERSGRGQVVDAAIVDGVISMMTRFTGSAAPAPLSLQSEKNVLGGRAPFYRCYECADGKYISVGSVEPPFYAQLLRRIGAPDELISRRDPADWPQVVTTLSQLFKQRSRHEWCQVLEGSDACFAPVLTYEESLQHSHLKERSAYI
jgi:alpha-methylacyl-CoA racemase